MHADNRISSSHCPSSAAPDDWIVFSQIWFATCRHFRLAISHHALAVAMRKADKGRQGWDAYLARAVLECQRQWELEDPRIQRDKHLHERRGVVFLANRSGWEIRLENAYLWQSPSLKTWLSEHAAQTAWFYEADAHVRPAQRRAEERAGAA